MKVIINNDFGVFRLNQKGLSLVQQTDPESFDNIKQYKKSCKEIKNIRTNPTLIKFVEEGNAEEIAGLFSELRMVEVPDDATDWEIWDYDGIETVIYVKDGKIHRVSADTD